MEIRISKESEVPLRQQVTEQIILLIATDKLKLGESLPSVRELARRLKIHHNTISHAYQDLVRRHWLVSRRGSHLVVIRAPDKLTGTVGQQDLDEMINITIELARRRGYSLQALRERMRERLLTQPPDHILVVEEEPGLRELLQEEIREAMPWPVEGCGRRDLASEPGLAVGALVATPQYAVGDTEPLVPRDRPAVPVAFGTAEESAGMIRKLRDPSVIAVVSVSQLVLQAAQGFLAPAIGRRHTLTQYLLPLENLNVLRGADLILCDSIALRHVKSPKRVHYRLAAPASIEYLSNAMESYQAARHSRRDGGP
jgi:DNA-binding transcriptional regulator YhcF (GntR family)